MNRISAIAAVIVSLGAFTTTANATHGWWHSEPQQGLAWAPIAPASPFTYQAPPLFGTPHQSFGGPTTYRDQYGNRMGSSRQSFGGGTTYSDQNGNRVGSSRQPWGGGY